MSLLIVNHDKCKIESNQISTFSIFDKALDDWNKKVYITSKYFNIRTHYEQVHYW